MQTTDDRQQQHTGEYDKKGLDDDDDETFDMFNSNRRIAFCFYLNGILPVYVFAALLTLHQIRSEVPGFSSRQIKIVVDANVPSTFVDVCLALFGDISFLKSGKSDLKRSRRFSVTNNFIDYNTCCVCVFLDIHDKLNMTALLKDMRIFLADPSKTVLVRQHGASNSTRRYDAGQLAFKTAFLRQHSIVVSESDLQLQVLEYGSDERHITTVIDTLVEESAVFPSNVIQWGQSRVDNDTLAHLIDQCKALFGDVVVARIVDGLS